MSRTLLSLACIGAISAAFTGCFAGESAITKSDIPKLKNVLAQPNHGGANLDHLMWMAVIENCPDCVPELAAAGAKPTSDHLVAAAIDGYQQVVKRLIEAGVDSNVAITQIQRDYGDDSRAQPGIESIRRIVQGTEQKSVSSDAAPMVLHSHLIPIFHEAERPNDYALIIGVEKYTDLPEATYAEADATSAKEFVRALGVPERNVVILTGARATRSGLAKQLEGWLTNNVNEKSTVYFYYSGHGAPDPRNGDAYLVPVDGDPQYLDQTAYPLKRVYERLGALKAKRVIVMLDSCFSGAGGRSVLAKGARPLVSKVDIGTDTSSDKISVLAAAGGDQISGTSEDNGHGLFTYYLLSGLNGAARDEAGDVTLKSLYSYLKPKVMDDARHANREQTPELMADPASSAMVLRQK